MRLLEVVHPAVKVLVDISLSQDSEAGDGTTTVVLLAGELLREVKGYVEEGVHPQAIARALRAAVQLYTVSAAGGGGRPKCSSCPSGLHRRRYGRARNAVPSSCSSRQCLRWQSEERRWRMQ